MNFDHEELVAIRQAKTDLKIWPYARYVILLLGFGMIIGSFWLITTELHIVQLRHLAQQLLIGIGITLLFLAVRHWNQAATKLLIKLAEREGSGAA